MADNNLAQTGYENYYLMLSDKIRMDAFRKAIFKTVKAGDIVVDMGAGTGLLSILALQYEYRCTQLKNEIAQAQAANLKTGRNDLCPCGSGKKYKKCCMN